MLVSRPTYTTRDTFTPCGIFYFYVEEPTYVSVSYDIHRPQFALMATLCIFYYCCSEYYVPRSTSYQSSRVDEQCYMLSYVCCASVPV